MIIKIIFFICISIFIIGILSYVILKYSKKTAKISGVCCDNVCSPQESKNKCGKWISTITSCDDNPCRSHPNKNIFSNKNVYEYTEKTNIDQIKRDIENVYNIQGGPNTSWAKNNNSYAFVFHPGIYDFKNFELKISFQTSLRGLGQNPSDTVFKNCKITIGRKKGTVTNIFWRDLENISLDSTEDVEWYTSQECPIRRFETKGNILLDGSIVGMYSSGGYISNVKANSIISHRQQQFCFKNVSCNNTAMAGMNTVYVNSETNLKNTTCGGMSSTVITNDHSVYDKPFILSNGSIRLPNNFNTNGYNLKYEYRDLNNIYVSNPNDTSLTINSEINKGNHIIFTAGTYNNLNGTIKINKDNICILAIGWPVLKNNNNNGPVFSVTGNNCTLAGGMLIDAGNVFVDSLVEFKDGTGSRIYDICCRVLRPSKCKTMMTINQKNTYGENIWLWVADHQLEGVNNTKELWMQMDNPYGLHVISDNVRLFGLAVEHQYDTMTQWDGNYGECYFYQSEFPYGGRMNNKPSYVVNDNVENHILKGGGAYFVVYYGFDNNPNIKSAFYCPDKTNVKMYPVLFNGLWWHLSQYVKHSLQKGNKLTPPNIIVCNNI